MHTYKEMYYIVSDLVPGVGVDWSVGNTSLSVDMTLLVWGSDLERPLLGTGVTISLPPLDISLNNK